MMKNIYFNSSTHSGLYCGCVSFSTGFTHGYSHVTPPGLREDDEPFSTGGYSHVTLSRLGNKTYLNRYKKLRDKIIPQGLYKKCKLHKYLSSQFIYNILIPKGLYYSSHGCNPWKQDKQKINPEGVEHYFGGNI